MREIKFRAWHKNSKRMCHYHVTTNLLDRDYLQFMQYTGLKDNTDKEIYEGDILEHTNGIKWIVGFKNGAFTLSFENSNINILYDCEIVDGKTKNMKVLGNIYENQELLNM